MVINEKKILLKFDILSISILKDILIESAIVSIILESTLCYWGLHKNDRELEMGLAGTGQSWHNEYKDSAWIFVGGLPYDLTEGDIICVFSQYGEIVHINLIRDHGTGKVRISLVFVPM